MIDAWSRRSHGRCILSIALRRDIAAANAVVYTYKYAVAAKEPSPSPIPVDVFVYIDIIYIILYIYMIVLPEFMCIHTYISPPPLCVCVCDILLCRRRQRTLTRLAQALATPA